MIGPRGSGKTTFLELIRHALGIEHADETEARRQRAAVKQLLGAGEVVLDIEDEHASLHLVVDATGAGRNSALSTVALALGQNELERIASNSASRLNLVDLRAVVKADPPSLDAAKKLTVDIGRLRRDAEGIRESTARRAVLERDRVELADQERALLTGSAEGLSERREVLRALEVELVALTGQFEASTRALRRITDAAAAGAQLRSTIAAVPSRDYGVAVAAVIEPRVASILETAGQLVEDLEETRNALSDVHSTLVEEQDRLRLKAAPIRAELESAEQGLGQITARLRNIDSELAEIVRAESSLVDLEADLAGIRQRRAMVLDEFETWQEGLFDARQAVARAVSEDLSSRVVVSVEHLADSTAFRELLVELLAGSGLQYRNLAESISRALLPRQLLTFVEHSDVDGLAAATGIASDRAARVVASLQEDQKIASLAGVNLDDRVDFKLVDGATEKSVEDLSTGQKCAVTLPIVLTEASRILILDQPEDHLDNAYLVKNIVTALTKRVERGAQTIVATHNANIPVLGSAGLVVSLESDGTRGYVVNHGAFDDQPIVETITGLMEGGRTAFLRRAEFYAEHDNASE